MGEPHDAQEPIADPGALQGAGGGPAFPPEIAAEINRARAVLGRYAITPAMRGVPRRVLATRLAEAEALLRAVEWAGEPTGRCASCLGYRYDGHAPDCRLAAWLEGKSSAPGASAAEKVARALDHYLQRRAPGDTDEKAQGLWRDVERALSEWRGRAQ